MKCLVLLLGLLFVAFADRAHAASDTCTADFEAMRKDLEPDCARLELLTKRRLELENQIEVLEEEAQPKADEIKKLKEESDNLRLEELALKSASPLLAKGLCAANVKTCDTLASLLTAGFDASSIGSVVAARRSEEAAIAKTIAAPDRQTSNNKSGSDAQTDPVEAIQPITLAGGTLALSGTKSGTKGVGVITVNPLALAAPDDNVAGRMLDLAVSAPFDFDQGTNEDRRYLSVRLRANLTAPVSAADLQQKVKNWLEESGRRADALNKILAQAKSVRKCAEYVARTNQVSAEACDQALDATELAKARKAAYDEIETARRAADRYYLGIDARFDTGDPTGPETIGDKGTHLLGGLAAGVRIPQSKTWDWELRGRAAGDYFASRDDGDGSRPDPVYSFDWGAAFILSGHVAGRLKQRLAFGVGVEGRHAASDREDALETPTDFANLNVMAVVPVASGGDFGLALSVPLAEAGFERGAVITLSTDFGLLDHSVD
jgi:hypothetical protein